MVCGYGCNKLIFNKSLLVEKSVPAEELIYSFVELLFVQLEGSILFVDFLLLVGHPEGVEIQMLHSPLLALDLYFLFAEF